jgi:hypothetical protein
MWAAFHLWWIMYEKCTFDDCGDEEDVQESLWGYLTSFPDLASGLTYQNF